jgi:adenosyl cobinamide kinase/adenosyl cobinamide phosphate guanylyltransferase
MSLTVILGGARSGKSAIAVESGKRHDGNVVYIATAPELDEDMADRIARHRAERPFSWTTEEEQIDIADAFEAAGDALVIIDCLTLWTSNLMWQDRTDDEIHAIASLTASKASERAAPTIAISNEVGMGVHPDTTLGRRYRDVLGRVNQLWVAASSKSLLLVAGRAIELGDPGDILEPGPNR